MKYLYLKVYGLPYARHILGPMENEAERLLWSVAEKQTSNRWPALYLLAIHAHRQSRSISGSMLTAYLRAQGSSQSEAERFGAEFDHYLDLLATYDRLRA